MIKNGENCNLKQQLNLMVDDQGILRCKGRYQNSELIQGAKYPKPLLPKEHYTRQNTQEAHRKMFHSGVSQTLAVIRLEYWIPKGRSEVKAGAKCVKLLREDPTGCHKCLHGQKRE